MNALIRHRDTVLGTDQAGASTTAMVTEHCAGCPGDDEIEYCRTRIAGSISRNSPNDSSRDVYCSSSDNCGKAIQISSNLFQADLER